MAKRAEAAVKATLRGYDEAEERRVREEQARLDAEARREQDRVNRLAEKRAERAEAKGDLDRAEEIRMSVPVVVAQEAERKDVPTVAGVAAPLRWLHEVVDLPALVKAVTAGEVPAEAVRADDAFLARMATEQRDLLRWPGVRVWSERGLSIGRG